MKIATSKAGEYIIMQAPFRTYGALRGDSANYLIYFIYSYDTVIAKWLRGEGWTLNNLNHSRTTEKHKAIVRRALASRNFPIGDMYNLKGNKP